MQRLDFTLLADGSSDAILIQPISWLLRHYLEIPVNGRTRLEIPAIDRLEDLPDPKRVLHDLLLTASEHTGRKRQKFNPGRQALRLGELIEIYGPLRHLYAFQHVEAATRLALDETALTEP